MIETWARRGRSGEEVKVTEGRFTYVAIDEQGRPGRCRRNRKPHQPSLLASRRETMRDEDQGGGGADNALSDREREKVEERTAPRAVVVHEIVRAEGEEELRRPLGALLWSGLAAGLSMGFSMVAQGLLQAGLPDAPWRPLVASFGYSRGLPDRHPRPAAAVHREHADRVLPVLYRRDRASVAGRALWGVVFVANIVGTGVRLRGGEGQPFRPRPSRLRSTRPPTRWRAAFGHTCCGPCSPAG